MPSLAPAPSLPPPLHVFSAMAMDIADGTPCIHSDFMPCRSLSSFQASASAGAGALPFNVDETHANKLVNVTAIKSQSRGQTDTQQELCS